MTAEKAMHKLNYSHINGKMIRITYSSRDSSARRSGIGNLFVKVCLLFNSLASVCLRLLVLF